MSYRPVTVILILALFAGIAEAQFDAPPAREVPKRQLVVLDALGEPLEMADVRLTIRSDASVDPVQIAPMKTDENGRISLPGEPQLQLTVDFSHKDWGIARATFSGLPPGEMSLLLPLVKRGSSEVERALHGRVIDPDGKPVAGAIIQCSNVRAPGGGSIWSHSQGQVLTNIDGQFVYYPPLEKPKQPVNADANVDKKLPEHRKLVPLNTRFDITVEIPGDEGFFPETGNYSNVEKTVITLKRPDKAFTIKYEAGDGGFITDPQKLRSIRLLRWSEDDKRLKMIPPRYVSGGKMPQGKYHAQVNFATFVPIEITADSPAELIFRLPPPVTYVGKVVHGITGEPMAGAFVLGMTGNLHRNLATLTEAEWEALYGLNENPALDAPALKPLKEMYNFDLVTRTNAKGEFTMISHRGKRAPAGLIVFAEDFLPLIHRLYKSKPDEKQRVEIRNFPLYPAAKIEFTAGFPDQLVLSAQWSIDKDSRVEWLDGFANVEHADERQFETRGWIQLNQPQTRFVPAGVPLQARFDAAHDEKWSAVHTRETFELKQRETKDIGQVSFIPSLVVQVKVVDEAGNPVEGVPVRQQRDESKIWYSAHNTDARGLAQFHILPYSTGRFAVTDIKGFDRRTPNLNVTYDVGEKVEGSDVYEIRITSEQVKAMRTP